MSTTLAFSGLVTRPALGQVIEGKSARDIKVERNFIKDGDAEIYSTSSVPSNMVTTGGTLAISTSSPLEGSKSFTYASTTSGQLLTINFAALSSKLKNGNCEASFSFSNTTSSWKAYVTLNSVKVSNEYAIPLSTDPATVPLNSLSFPCGDLTYAPKLVIESTAASAGTIKLDSIIGSKNANIGTVAQASFFGGMEQAGAGSCIYSENTSTGLSDFKDLGSGSGCNAWTVSGSVTATGTNDHRPVLSNLAPGTYQVTISGVFLDDTANQLCTFRLSDGTTTYQPQGTTVPNAANGAATNVLTYTIPYTTPQSSITLKLQAADNGAGSCSLYNVANLNAAWKIYYFPSQAQTVVNMNQSNYGATAYTPTITGVGTPTGVSFFHKREGEFIYIWGYGVTGTVTGSAVSFTLPDSLTIDTTKGTSTGSRVGDVSVSGASIYMAKTETATSTSLFYIAGTSVTSKSVGTDIGNTTAFAINAKIPISGWTENQNAPLLVGGVTSNTSGMERIERATVNCSSSSSVTSQSGSWISSVGNISSGVCSITLAAGIFSATPSCTVAHNASDAGVVSMNQLLANSATSLSYTCRYVNSGSSTVNNCTSASANIICMGAR